MSEQRRSIQCGERIKDWILLVYHQTHDLDHDVSLRYFVLKLVWLVGLCLSIALSVAFMFQNIIRYYNYEVSTDIRDIYHDNMAFPVVTICNSNPLATLDANRYIQKYYLDKYKVNLTSADEFVALLNKGVLQNENEYIFYMTFAPEFNQSLRELFGNDLMTATFMNDLTGRALSGFENYYDSMYGNCKRFNTGNFMPVRMVDSKNDVLRIFAFLGLYSNPTNLYDSWTNGLVVSVDDQSDYPISLKKGVAIKPGTMTQMSIKKNRAIQMPAPYNNCKETKSIDTLLSRELAKLNMNYSHTNCLILCLQKQTIDETGCYDMRYPRIFDAPPCRDESAYRRLRSVRFVASSCADVCPHECHTTRFDVAVSYFDFPSYVVFKRILSGDLEHLEVLFRTKNITYDMFSKSLAAVNIYFSEIKTTVMEETAAMTFVELLGNIGGTISLFISFSLLGFVEFLELVVQAAFAKWSKHRRQQRRRREDDPIAISL